MTVNGKRAEIGLDDLVEAGRRMEIKERRCKDIINEVKAAVDKFDSFAEQVGIKEKTARFINSIIAANTAAI